LIGQRTFDLIGKGFVTEPVGEARLKGKEQVIRIYRVLGCRDEGPGERRDDGQATTEAEKEPSRLASGAPS
jgi:class 3 adenylate cyclase